MSNLPWFTAKPIQLGDVYPLADMGRHRRSVQVTEAVKFDWPKWVRWEVTFLNKDGTLGGYKDYTGDAGGGLLNCWGPWLLRTKYELFKYELADWFMGKRRNLAHRIYPRD